MAPHLGTSAYWDELTAYRMEHLICWKLEEGTVERRKLQLDNMAPKTMLYDNTEWDGRWILSGNDGNAFTEESNTEWNQVAGETWPQQLIFQGKPNKHRRKDANYNPKDSGG